LKVADGCRVVSEDENVVFEGGELRRGAYMFVTHIAT